MSLAKIAESKVLGNRTTVLTQPVRWALDVNEGDILEWFNEGTYLVVRKKDKKPLVVKDGRILA